MNIVIIAIHVLVSVALILIVLLQTGKGADMGAAFGGSSQTIFGSAGPAGFLNKLTTVAAVVFMLTSLSLAFLSGQRIKGTIMKETRPPMDQSTSTKPQSGPTAQPSAGNQPAAPNAEQRGPMTPGGK